MLRNRSLLALLVAEFVSHCGTTMTFVALPWFVLETTGSAARMSVVLAAELVPMALFGIPSGSLVARLGARRTMLLGDAVRAPLIALVPVLHWAGALDFGVLLAIVFAVGLFTAPYFASQRSIVPELFGGDELVVTKASALFGLVARLTTVLGPAIGGLLIAWLGAPSVLLVDAGTFLFAFVCVLLLVHAGQRLEQTDDSRGMLAGVRYLARDSLLGPLTLTVIVLDMGAAGIGVAIPVVAFVRYDENAHVAGWLLAAFGIGAVAGSLVVMKLLDRFRPLRLASVGVVLATIPLWLPVAPAPWPFVALAYLACGFFIPFVNAPAVGIISTRPPAELRAKVMTCVITASALGGPFGRLAVGPVYEWGGLDAMFAAVAGVMSLGAVLFATAALRADAREQRVLAQPVTQ